MMYKCTYIVFACLLFAACEPASNEVGTDLINIGPSASNSSSSSEMAILALSDTLFDFGLISEGEKVKHTYAFTNSGKAPLLISAVEPSCGCTAVKDWSKRPYAPGESGTITVVFDSDKRPGKQHKSISVITNANPSVHTLLLTGTVIGPTAQ